MSFAAGLARQLSHPEGLVGKALGGVMDLANRKPTRVALDLLDARPGEAVLDVGCGTGEALAELLRTTPCHVSGIDPSPAMLNWARQKLGWHSTLYEGTVEGCSLPDASFDAVLALNVLYFCAEDGGMARAVHRLLKPGGRLVAYVTHRDTMQGWSFTREGLHRLYDEPELVDLLVQGGFAPEAIRVHTAPVTRNVKGIWVQATRRAI